MLTDAVGKGLPLEGKWNLAYHAEKLVLSLLAPERQKIEFQRRMSECRGSGVPFIAFYEEQLITIANEDDDVNYRDMLLSLVSDMQRYNSNKHIKMRYARHAINRVGTAFCLALTFFLVTISFFHWD